MLRREIKLGQGMVGWCYLDRLARECLSHKSAFEQGPESSDGAGHVVSGGRSFQPKGTDLKRLSWKWV